MNKTMHGSVFVFPVLLKARYEVWARSVKGNMSLSKISLLEKTFAIALTKET